MVYSWASCHVLVVFRSSGFPNAVNNMKLSRFDHVLITFQQCASPEERERSWDGVLEGGLQKFNLAKGSRYDCQLLEKEKPCHIYCLKIIIVRKIEIYLFGHIKTVGIVCDALVR